MTDRAQRFDKAKPPVMKFLSISSQFLNELQEGKLLVGLNTARRAARTLDIGVGGGEETESQRVSEFTPTTLILLPFCTQCCECFLQFPAGWDVSPFPLRSSQSSRKSGTLQIDSGSFGLRKIISLFS